MGCNQSCRQKVERTGLNPCVSSTKSKLECLSSKAPPEAQSNFKYQPLDTTQDSFRLLRLHYADPGQPVRCDLFNAKLCDWKGRYKAGSYVWGSSENQKSILVNGHGFFVRRNLSDFLCACRLHHPEQSITIWIDAICIDQGSILERNHQVLMMASIYSNSECVYSWQGQADQHSDHLFDTLNGKDYRMIQDAESTDPQGQHGLDRNNESQRVWSFTRNDAGSFDGILTSLESFASRIYWKRIWIVQELCLAPDVLLLSGEKVLSWSRLPFDYVYDKIELRVSTEGRMDSILMSRLCNLPNSTIFKVNELRIAKSAGVEPYTFEQIYLRFGRMLCSVQHDSVFALLGLIIAPNLKPGNRLVNYALSKSQLITQTLCNFSFRLPLDFAMSALDTPGFSSSELSLILQSKPAKLGLRLELSSSECWESWPVTDPEVSASMSSQLYNCIYTKNAPLAEHEEKTTCFYTRPGDSPKDGDRKLSLSYRVDFIVRLRNFDEITCLQIVGMSIEPDIIKLSYRENQAWIVYVNKVVHLVNVSRICTRATPIANDQWLNVNTESNAFLCLAWYTTALLRRYSIPRISC